MPTTLSDVRQAIAGIPDDAFDAKALFQIVKDEQGARSRMAAQSFAPGDRVRHKTRGVTGAVERVHRKNVSVHFDEPLTSGPKGYTRYKVPAADLEPITED